MTLDEYMSREGLTLLQVARAVGVSESAVHRWRSGSRRPSLASAMKIKALTRGEVQMGDLVDVAEVRAPVEALRSVGRPPTGPGSVERWLRSLGLKAVGLLCAQVPGAPSRARITAYMEADPRPRWVVRERSRPSVWVGDSAIQVADSYRVVQSLRDKGLVLGVEVWRQGEEDQITRF
jgi:DNA-binding XRE family transcriptional regulator